MRWIGLGATALLSYEMVLDSASRIAAIEDHTPGLGAELSLSARFEYDDLYRLTRASSASTSSAWSYDDGGNLLFAEENGSRREYEYADPTTPDRVTRVGGGAPLAYDDAGRVTREGPRELTWDARGRLARVEHEDGRFEEYVYGYDGSRAVKRAGRAGYPTEETRYIDRDVEERAGQLTRYAFLGPLRAVRMDSTLPVSAGRGALSAGAVSSLGGSALALLLVSLLGALLGTRRGRIAAGAGLSAALALALVACGIEGTADPRTASQAIDAWPAGAVQYLHDPVGTVVASVDARGDVVGRSARTPYGASRASEGHVEPWGFGGNEEDEIGLGDFAARPYSAELGRFLAPDPVPLFEVGRALGARPQASALYGYAAGDPVNAIDPNGEFAIVIPIAVGVVALAAAVVLVHSYATTGGPPQPPEWFERAVDGLTLDPRVGVQRMAEGAQHLAQRVFSGEIGRQITEATASDAAESEAEQDADAPAGDPPEVIRLPDDRLTHRPRERGRAPIADDGNPVEIHHDGQDMDSQLEELTRTDHRGRGSFGSRHGNTGQSPSKIDRRQFAKQRREHWEREWDSGRFDDLPEQPPRSGG